MDKKTESGSSDTSKQESRMDRIEARRGGRRNTWIFGAVLAAAGVILLIQNTTHLDLYNWEPLLLLIPAVALLVRGVNQLQVSEGKLTSHARGSLIASFVFFVITAVLFFNLDTNIYGPILLVIIGLALVANSVMPKD
jgi:hypothetical protein